MTNERYPVDLPISITDFLASGWKDVLTQAPREGYASMWRAFSAAARSAIEEGRGEHGKVLWLLADACSMILSPSSPNEPFKPFAITHDKRSVIADDFLDSDIQFFAEIIDSIDDDLLRARLSDLVWLKRKPKNPDFALKAIDAYVCLPLNQDSLFEGGNDCWLRAILLTRMLKRGAGDRLLQIETTIFTAFNESTKEDGFLALKLAALLETNGLGHQLQANIAQKLEMFARNFEAEGELHKCREYFAAASTWYKSIPDKVKATEMLISIAESWEADAKFRSSSSDPSYMMAASFYENAIQSYRIVPKAERPAYQVDERIARLRIQLNECGEKALGELAVVKTSSGDISNLVKRAIDAVSSKPVEQALLEFANLYGGAKVEELRKSAQKSMQQFPLQSLFASTFMSRDGRVIAKSPGMSLSGDATPEDGIAMRNEMIKNYCYSVKYVVYGYILPALEALLLEHRLQEADFVGLARQSPIVPKNRAALFGKALFAGYDCDFTSALHLLIPQIENMVRVHLKQAGAKTTNLDNNGIQNENGMSTLLELPEAELVFGADLLFELDALFCNPFGPNLRNELAHGLLDENGCNSPDAVYAWWLMLKLVLKAWWNAASPAPGFEDEDQQAEASRAER
jgi:hypothetical protein